MKRLFCAALIALGLAACQKATQEQPEKKAKEFWFYMHSAEAKVTPKGKSYVITLDGHNIYYLSDRPYHDSGALAREEFVSIWKSKNSNTQKDPPNAAFFGKRLDDKSGDPIAITVVISDIQYNAKTDRMNFIVRPLNPEHSFPAGTTTYDEVVFFIDSFGSDENGMMG